MVRVFWRDGPDLARKGISALCFTRRASRVNSACTLAQIARFSSRFPNRNIWHLTVPDRKLSPRFEGALAQLLILGLGLKAIKAQ